MCIAIHYRPDVLITRGAHTYTRCSIFHHSLCDEESILTIPVFVCSKLQHSPVTGVALAAIQRYPECLYLRVSVWVRVLVLVRLSVKKTKSGPVRRLSIALPVSTQSGPQRRIYRPDRIRLPLFTQL